MSDQRVVWGSHRSGCWQRIHTGLVPLSKYKTVEITHVRKLLRGLKLADATG
ncbi:MAG TPA: hypothetical protein VHV32_05960 [Candidatus Angelobacter sp.]|nr:hypothetical protein [Candidatus Angelobacter sp.]